MKEIKRDLVSLHRELKALTNKAEKMAHGLDELEKALSAEAQGKSAKKNAVRRATKGSATGTVFDIIKRARKGVDTPTLKKKTGFDERKIWSIINNLKRQGKVKSDIKGVYVKT